DHLLLESGVLRLHSGPGGSFASVTEVGAQDQPRWETPQQRHAGRQAPFQLNIGREITPGGPVAGPMMPVIASDTEVAWEATLDPFSSEFPPGTDWITFVRSNDPGGEAAKAVQAWNWADERNPALKAAIPGQFMRGTVIKNANRDLAIAASNGFAATFDP